MNSIPACSEAAATPRLLDQVSGKIRLKRCNLHTEQTYSDWISRFIRHFGKRHPRDFGAAEVGTFPTHLEVVGQVAASTQNPPKRALLFLYREVLGSELPWLDNVEQAKAPRRLRVEEIEFARGEIVVRDGKRFKDRVTMLPASLSKPLGEHLSRVKTPHEQDLADGGDEVLLPYALARKYPGAGREWGWQLVFPAGVLSIGPLHTLH